MIEVQGLTKRYGSVTAVDNVSFTVKPGVVTGFLGPNGAGKSTTMRMIVGLDKPTSGTATIDGRPYSELPRPLTKVGALLDAKAVHPNRTALNHLRWLAYSNGIPESRVQEVLSLVGLEKVAKQRAGGFSLGMGQRLGLAGALLGDPEILILDEPVNGLDPEGIRWVRRLFKHLAAEGRTVLVSSHLLSEMSQTAEHLVVIGRGKLVADMPTSEFIRTHSATVVVVRTVDERMAELGDALRGAGFAATSGRDSDGRSVLEINGAETTTETVGDLAFAAGIPVFELYERAASLEDAFIQTTGSSVDYHARTDFAGLEERN